MIKCSECGYENMDGLDYCDGCGAKLNAAAPSNPAGGGGSAAPTAASESDAEAAHDTKVDTHADGQQATGEEGIDAKATPALAAEVGPEAGTPSSEVPTGELKKEQPAAPAQPAAEQTSTAAAFRARLSVVRGGRKGQEFPLEDGNNLVGRWDPETGSFPEVDLDADDPEAKISRKHALIRIDGGKITIEDIGSLNGTYVNRQPRLSPGTPAEIKTGDEVIIGKTFLKLIVEPIS
jgi:hypothetical protein